ncbi:nuclease-related domain-containing protein [Neobacillus sp. FSL H8-0543]|uniref:nuclease-related domain-containing protein n=1 Tax=Neobacillus sp. FSL H8-0543 TaxID=2954672 RepID=UPI0031587C50
MNHPKRPIIKKDLGAWLKGYYGEKDADYYLSFLPEEKYLIFHGLRLKDTNYFQMDLLLISTSFALIIEVKNISGKLIFKKGSNLVVKEFDNNEEGMPNPIQQVKRQQIQYMNWLNKRQLKGLPVESLVMISKTTTIVETTPDNHQIFQQLIYAESLLDKIRELGMKYQKPRISQKRLLQLSDTLLKEHKITIPDILQKYQISQSELIPGVQCSNCKSFPMKYFSANWHCSYCNFISKTAHFQTVDDYFLLINQTITRKQFAQVLQIEATSKAKNLLLALKLPNTGSKRGTRYNLCILSPHDENDSKKGEFYR